MRTRGDLVDSRLNLLNCATVHDRLDLDDEPLVSDPGPSQDQQVWLRIVRVEGRALVALDHQLKSKDGKAAAHVTQSDRLVETRRRSPFNTPAIVVQVAHGFKIGQSSKPIR